MGATHRGRLSRTARDATDGAFDALAGAGPRPRCIRMSLRQAAPQLPRVSRSGRRPVLTGARHRMPSRSRTAYRRADFGGAPTGAASTSDPASTSGPASFVVLVARFPEQDMMAEATVPAAMARVARLGTGIDLVHRPPTGSLRPGVPKSWGRAGIGRPASAWLGGACVAGDGSPRLRP